MINPLPQYDQANEAQYRRQVENDSLKALRTDRAAPFLLITGDDGATYKVSVVAGALDVQPL